MKYWIMLYVFIFSVCMGSFMNVLIDRIPLKLNYVNTRSYCMTCMKILKWYELIPIISYIILKGRCSSCHDRIQFRIWIIEWISGILGILCFYQYGYHFIYPFILIELLIVLSFIDIQYMILPNQLVLMILFLSSGFIYHSNMTLYHHILGMLIIPGMILLINIIKKNSFGMGDIKLLMASGLCLGINDSIMAFIITILTASFYAIFHMFIYKDSLKTRIPFGPFISLGVILVLLFKEELLLFYLYLITI